MDQADDEVHGPAVVSVNPRHIQHRTCVCGLGVGGFSTGCASAIRTGGGTRALGLLPSTNVSEWAVVGIQ